MSHLLLIESCLRLNCFHCGFAADYLQCRPVPSSRRMVRDPGRSTQASSSSQDLPIHSCPVLFFYVRRRLRWSLLSPSRGSKQRAMSSVRMTRELDLLSGEILGLAPIFQIAREHPRTKIRAESSSNGSESCGVPVSLRTKSELSSHQMASQLVVADCRGSPRHFHAELL